MARRVNAAAEDRDLDNKIEADRKAQERGPADHSVGRTSRTFVHTTHPETGLDVVFLPGEMLPSWVRLAPEQEA